MSDIAKNLSLHFNAKIQPINKLNEQFTYCKCYAHALGKNRNWSHFSKENVIRNADSMNYIPVIGHLIEKEDGSLYMGSHDVEYYIDDKELKIKYLTVPFGVVVNDTMAFEDVTESDGTIVTYVVVDVILWTGRYPELLDAIYSEDIYFNESMEINYSKFKPLEEDKNYTDIIDWVYSALCLLGKADDVNSIEHTEPCFPSSRVEPYSNKFNQSEFAQVMSELKTQLSFYFDKQKNGNKKGGEVLNEEIKNSILQEFNLTLDDIKFEITDEMSEEEFRLKLEEFTKTEPETSKPNQDVTLFSATYRQKREALSNALSSDIQLDSNGNLISETNYWVEDFDDSNVFVEKDVWTANDYNSYYGRFAYAFDDATLTATITSEFEEMVKVWLTIEENQKLQEERAKYELIQTEFDEYKNNYSTPNSEVDVLKKFQTETLDTQRSNDEKELFEKFDEELSSMEEYSKVKENSKDYSIEQLSEKLFALLGKKNATFSVKKKDEGIPKIPVGAVSTEEDPYGGLLSKYYEK